jgi:PAS domain S-box-containing protein
MLFDTTFAGASPDDALSFIVEILQSFTEYSIIGEDLNGRILLWNEGARRLYGYEPEEVIGRAQADILHTPEDIAAGKPASILQEALRRGKWEGLLTRLRKDGSRFVTRAVATPRFDTGGLHTGYLLVSKDATNEVAAAHAANLEREAAARQQTERALADRARQASLIAQVGAILTRSDTAQEMLQRCAEALAGYLEGASAGIWTLDEVGNSQLQANAGPALDGEPVRPIPLARIGAMVKERRPHISNDVANDPWIDDKDWVESAGITACAVYPLMLEDRLAGVLAVYARGPFSPEAVEAIGTAAQEIVLGIQRKDAERALHDREEHIRLLLNSTAEAIYGIDLQGLCTFANAACARLLGYNDTSQFIGRNMHALIHHTRADGTSYPMDECRIYQGFRRGEPSHIQDEVLWRAEGSSFPAEYWSYPIRRGGEVVGSVVTFLDITERRQLETQFRKAQQRLRHIVVSSPAVLFTLAIVGNDLEGISWISDNVWEIFGYPPEVALGTEWWLSCIHPDDRERAMAQTRADLFSRGHCTEEYRFRCADGSYRWTRVEIRLTPEEAVGAWTDINERKLAEEEQAKLRGQLQQAQKLESVGRLAGGVAHDFNNLLTVINGYSGMLLKRLPVNDPIREDIEEIQIAGKRAAVLTRQLLLLARQQMVQVQQVQLNDVVTEVQTMLRCVIGEDIVPESVLDPTLGFVLADPGRLHQVLMNLAVNARDAMPGGGKLLIETQNVELDRSFAELHAGVEPGSYVQLKVTDTGVGMTPEVLSHLYEPFFTTKAIGEGTGLGLATVYGIIQQSQGSIWVYSEPGEGTTFTIYLPRSDRRETLPAKPEDAPATLRGTETLLVVEDQDQLRRMAVKVLRDHGYRVIEGSNPGEALLHCERYPGPIHLLLSDVVMPGMTGPEMVERIRPLRPSIKVLFMSGYSEQALKRHHDLELAGGYLQKPFSAEALATRVRKALDPRRPAGTILVVDDEPAVRHLIRKILAGVGYQVLEAGDGGEAVRIIEANDIDLMITDLAMPEQEGLETIQRLHHSRPGLRMVAMSGKFPELLRASEYFGAVAAIRKPIEPDELLKLVRNLILKREGK